MAEFVPADLPTPVAEIIPPAIDPRNPKNLPLGAETARDVLEWIGVRTEHPLVTQVSRFDPWKDPLGVIEAYRLARREVPDLQLALVGSMLGMLVALYHRDLFGEIAIGIYGYNASLAAIALYLWRPSLLAPVLGILISTPITEYFPLTGLPTLTAPFVLASWLVIAVGSVEKLFVERAG